MRLSSFRRIASQLFSFAGVGIARRVGHSSRSAAIYRRRNRESFNAWRLHSEPLEGRAMLALTAPTNVQLSPVGGTVVADTLNASNTHLQISADIVAGEATGGSAEFYIGETLFGTDTTIAEGDTSVDFDTSDGNPTPEELQAAIAAGGQISVKLISGDSDITATGPTLTVDYTSPTVTAANISLSGSSGTGGAFKIGDTVTATWDNTATGDNNADTISGVTVDFSEFGAAAPVTATHSSGTWTATYTIVAGTIDATSRNVSVTATDNAGNATTTASTDNASVDNVAPTVTAANISLSGASGTGGAFKIGDTVTATWDNTGDGDNNADTISSVTVDFSEFGGGAAVVASNSSGTWTATYTIVAGTIDATSRNVSVTATDNAGNATTTAGTNNASVNNIVPNLRLTNDTGVSNSDGITKNGSVTVSGVETGATWQYSTNGGATWSAPQLKSTTVFTLSPGTYAAGRVRVRQTDGAGTVGDVISNPAEIKVDTAAPVAPTFGLTNDTGVSNRDGVTKNGSVTVSGVETGATWEYRTKTDGSWTNWTTGTGSAFTLPAGTYAKDDVQVRQTDVAGNISSTRSNPAAITVDTTAPAAPTLSFSDTGVSSDGITNDGSVTVSDVETGATWQYSTNGGATWSAPQPKSTSVFILFPGTYAAGRVRVRQTDVAGNTSPTRSNDAITVDTTAPVAPALALTSDTGVSGDGITNDGSVTVSDVETGATWQYSTNAGATWTTGTGSTFTLLPGTYAVGRVRVRQTDAAGNISSTRSNPAAITIDNTAAAPTFALTSDTGVSNSDGITKNGSVTVSGVETGATWQYSTNGGATWSAPQPKSTSVFTLLPGTYAEDRVRVQQTDVAGNTSPTRSNPGAITVKTTAPAAPTLSFSDTGVSGDGITNDGSVTVSDVETGATWQYSTNAGATWTTGTGSTFTLLPGTYVVGRVRVRQTDAAGNTSPTRSNPAAITVDTTAAAPTFALTSDTGVSNSDGITKNGSVTVSGVETGATWQYSTDAGLTWTTGTGSAFTLSPPGTYAAGSVRVRQTDVAGNISSTRSNPAAITVDTTAPTIASVSSTDSGTKQQGNFVTITVTFSETVFVAGVPTLMLNTSPQRKATYESGSGTDTLTFKYKVLLGDFSSNLNYASSSALADGTIRDRAGNDADRTTLPDPTLDDLNPGNTITIDALLRASADDFYTNADDANNNPKTTPVTEITIKFNASVTGVTLSQLKLYRDAGAGDELVSLADATLTGSGASYKLKLPSSATSSAGLYHLDIGGTDTKIRSGTVFMSTVSSIFWLQE